MAKLTSMQLRFLAEVHSDEPFGLWPHLFETFKVRRLVKLGLVRKVGPFCFLTPAGRAALSQREGE